jgi:hypothetical protein
MRAVHVATRDTICLQTGLNAPVFCPEHEGIVTAGRGDYSGSLEVLPAHDVGEVGRIGMLFFGKLAAMRFSIRP